MVRHNVWMISAFVALMLGCGRFAPPPVPDATASKDASLADQGSDQDLGLDQSAAQNSTPLSDLPESATADSEKVDAEVVLQQALAEAANANKNVLVHLGAPW